MTKTKLQQKITTNVVLNFTNSFVFRKKKLKQKRKNHPLGLSTLLPQIYRDVPKTHRVDIFGHDKNDHGTYLTTVKLAIVETAMVKMAMVKLAKVKMAKVRSAMEILVMATVKLLMVI